MKVDVYMKNGRTIFRFEKRAHLLAAIQRNQEKTFQGSRLFCQVKHHLDAEDWETASVRALNPSAISFVLEVGPESESAA